MKDAQSPYSSSSSSSQSAVPIFLSGHSSGCHIVTMLLLRNALGMPGHSPFPIPISGFFGLSGVYDIEEHFFYESRRGVHEISGMKPANKGISEFNRHSPTFLAAQLTPEQVGKLVFPFLPSPSFEVVHLFFKRREKERDMLTLSFHFLMCTTTT